MNNIQISMHMQKGIKLQIRKDCRNLIPFFSFMHENTRKIGNRPIDKGKEKYEYNYTSHRQSERWRW